MREDIEKRLDKIHMVNEMMKELLPTMNKEQLEMVRGSWADTIDSALNEVYALIHSQK